MSNSVLFPHDRRGLQTWVLVAGMAAAEAVLIHPRRPKRGGQRIMVLKGSRFQAKVMDSCPPSVVKIRQMMLRFGKLRDERDGMMSLTEDVVFASPSQAANAVHGESKNGWAFWKLGDHRGPSLDEEEQKELTVGTGLIYYEKPEGVIEIRPR